jgi:hypothetical protein
MNDLPPTHFQYSFFQNIQASMKHFIFNHERTEDTDYIFERSGANYNKALFRTLLDNTGANVRIGLTGITIVDEFHT